MILSLLPSKDVLHLKLASSFVAASELTHAFWKSRFLPGSELGHFPEALSRSNTEIMKGKWLNLYKALEVSQLGEKFGLINRTRIYGLVQPIVGLLRVMNQVSFESAPEMSTTDKRTTKTDTSWRMGDELIWDPPEKEPFWRRKSIRTATVKLPKTKSCVCLSLLQFNGCLHVTGMRFTTDKRGEFRLGYLMPHKEETLEFERESQVNLAELHGFLVTLSSRGVHGIAIMDKGGRVSN